MRNYIFKKCHLEARETKSKESSKNHAKIAIQKWHLQARSSKTTESRVKKRISGAFSSKNHGRIAIKNGI